jgi:hypothetical protein
MLHKFIVGALATLVITGAWAGPDFLLRSDGAIVTIGGESGDTQVFAQSQCKARGPFVQYAILFKEQANIRGRLRFYKCSYHQGEADKVRPSSIKQRVLQTRKFSKGYDELANGLRSWARDMGGVTSDAKSVRRGNEYRAIEIYAFFTFQYMPNFLKLEIIVDDAQPDFTVLRIRTYDQMQEEFFNEDFYRLIFNEIAQQLFTEGIAINPQEIQ